jgi:hypothetical protein
MRTHKITVTVDHDRIQVNPDPLVMFKADEVQWAGTNARKFSIEFDGDGPFGNRRLEHAVATGTNRPNAKGRYKYTVVSEENAGLRLDPVIVIDEPPSGSIPG